jgi:hypothetical protein
MPLVEGTICTVRLAAFAAAVLGGGLYLLTYRPYAKKKREHERAAAAAAARAGGLAALGQPDQQTPQTESPLPPHAPFRS